MHQMEEVSYLMTMSIPQTYRSLRNDNANPCDTTLLPHHVNQSELCMSWSHILKLPSFILILKMIPWNSSKSSGFSSISCPRVFVWRFTISTALSFTTTQCQSIGLTAEGQQNQVWFDNKQTDWYREQINSYQRQVGWGRGKIDEED